MYIDKLLSSGNLENFNYEETKKNVTNYFMKLEKLEWEWAKLNTQKGLITDYDFVGCQKPPYISACEDVFNLEAKEEKEAELKKHRAGYHQVKSVLSSKEQIYIEECFVNLKNENEIVKILGLASTDCNEFRKLKKSAVFKFADVLDLVVEKL